MEREALAAYGRAVGAAFQIADDILDLEGTPEAVGKAVGKDAGAGKATLVAALGREKAGALLAELVREAHAGRWPLRQPGRDPRRSRPLRGGAAGVKLRCVASRRRPC